MVSWTQTELARAKAILQRAQHQKSGVISFIDSLLYWIALLLAILGNFVLAVVLVPYLLLLKGPFLYLSIFLIGLSFGFVFTFILRHVQRLDNQKHLVASLLIPCLALISLVIISTLSNKLIFLLELETPAHQPLLVGISYVVGYIIPDVVVRATKRKILKH